MIRWWVSHPINQDLYCVFVVQSHDDHPESDQWYWHDGTWKVAPFGAIIQPALQLPGILAQRMVEHPREDVALIEILLRDLAEEIWQERNQHANNTEGLGQEV